MAVIYPQGGGGRSFLGTLGGIASLGGMLIPGATLLTGLGSGLTAIDGALRGDPASMAQMAQQIMTGKLGDWFNPSQGDLSKPGGVSQDPAWREAYERLRRQAQVGF